MNTHLMTFVVILIVITEAGVVNQIGAIVGSSNHGVVTLRTFAQRHIAPMTIGTHQFLTTGCCVRTIVEAITGEYSTTCTTISIGTVRFLRTEYAHLVTALLIQETITHKQVIVASNILYIGTLARYVVASSYAFSKIGVATGYRIGHVIIPQTCLLIQFQDEDATTPRAVGHPELTFLVIKDTGVYIVWHTSFRGACPRTVIACG